MRAVWILKVIVMISPFLCRIAAVAVVGFAWPTWVAGQDAMPVPSAAVQRASIQRVREIFQDDFAKAKSPEQQAALASTLIDHSRDTKEAADVFALLEVARGIAIDIGDVAAAARITGQLSARFAVNAYAMEAETLLAMTTRAPAHALGPVVDGLVSAAGKSAGAGDAAGAEDLLKSAAAAARKARDKQRQEAVLAELKRVREQSKALEKVSALVKRLQSDPSDREAATALGKHRCFVEGDWEAGLALLARGDDATLAGLAAAEIRPSGDVIALGDAWSKYGESLKSADRGPPLARAVAHYRTGLTQLNGLDRVRVEKQIAAIEQTLGSVPSSQGATRPAHAVFWLDASVPGSVLGVDGRPIRGGSASGEPVATWKDPSVRSLSASAAAPASAPLFTPGAIGGNPALAFKGGQLLVAKGPVPAEGAILVVAQTSSPIVNGCILGSATTPLTLDTWTRSEQSLWVTLYPKQGDMQRSNSQAGAYRAGEPFLFTVGWSQPFFVRVNGKEHVSRKDFPADVLGLDEFVIGAHDAGGRYPFSGFVGEILILNAIPAGDDLVKLESGLMQKWRIRP